MLCLQVQLDGVAGQPLPQKSEKKTAEALPLEMRLSCISFKLPLKACGGVSKHPSFRSPTSGTEEQFHHVSLMLFTRVRRHEVKLGETEDREPGRQTCNEAHGCLNRHVAGGSSVCQTGQHVVPKALHPRRSRMQGIAATGSESLTPKLRRIWTSRAPPKETAPHTAGEGGGVC